jgi:rfaE bifunctional protein kinase chain/domain
MLNLKIKKQIKENRKYFHKKRILCIGDLILDDYQIGEVIGKSPEAPVPILSFLKNKLKIGGVGNVANNILSLGGKVTLISLIGKDEASQNVKKLIKQNKKIKFCPLANKDFSTPLKKRFINGHEQILRVDNEKKNKYTKSQEIRFLKICNSEIKKASLVVLSDYDKGTLTKRILKTVIKYARSSNIQVIIDPKKEDFSNYSGADMITPNSKEFNLARKEISKKNNDISKIGNEMCKKYNIKEILLTRSEKGMILLASDNSKTYKATAKKVYDVTGAGDTVVATMALMKSIGFSSDVSTYIAEAAAANVISKFGTARIKIKDLLN